MGTLGLPQSHRSNVWKVIKDQIESDPTWDEHGITLQFFEGDPSVLSDLDTQAPVLQFEPRMAGRQTWFTEGSMSGSLVVQVTAVVRTYDVNDTFALQDAIERCLNTIDDPDQLQERLVEARAVTGLITFDQPLVPAPGQPTGGDGLFRLRGSFAVEVERPLNPA